MATRKLFRDLLITKQPLLQQLMHRRILRTNERLRSLPAIGYASHRRFSVFSDFSKQIRREADSNPEFQRTVKELKEKSQELKGVKEDLKVRTKETTEQLYKQVDDVWTEAEATAKKVSSSVKDKLSAATEEVKESFKFVKEENAESASSEGEKQQQPQPQSGTTEELYTFFGKIKSSITSPIVFEAFHKLKEAKPFEFAKMGLDIVKDEFRGNPPKKKLLEYTPPPPFTGERSSRTEMVITQTKQSKWQQKWESFRQKMQGYPGFKRLRGMSEPVVNKSQEIAEDVMEIWETSDNPIVHKIQDMNDTFFTETGAASTYKEIRNRDPSFYLPDFVAEVEEAIRPVLNAYVKGDAETLKKYCSKEVIERCTAQLKAFQSHGYFFDTKLLHISEVHVQEKKMMGNSPIITVRFQTQEIYCVRDKDGKIREGGQDEIHTVIYDWAMQQVDAAELGEDAIYPIWRLREMQRHELKSSSQE